MARSRSRKRGLSFRGPANARRLKVLQGHGKHSKKGRKTIKKGPRS